MNEVRRFLRFTLPGIACALQLIIAISISDKNQLNSFLGTATGKESIGLVLAGFLASGALGYILSTIYFALYWLRPIAKRVAIDHLTLFEQMNSYITIKGPDGKSILVTDLSKRTAWVIATRYWFSRYEKSECIKSINPTIDRLIDVTHGLGATIIGSILTIVAWTCIHWYVLSKSFGLLVVAVVAVWAGLLTLMIISYIQTLEAVQSLINSTLAETIVEQFNENDPEAVTILYSP